MQKAIALTLWLMERALFQGGLMEKSELSCLKVANFIGLLTMLISLAIETWVELLVSAQQLIAKMSYQEDRMVKLGYGT